MDTTLEPVAQDFSAWLSCLPEQMVEFAHAADDDRLAARPRQLLRGYLGRLLRVAQVLPAAVAELGYLELALCARYVAREIASLPEHLVIACLASEAPAVDAFLGESAPAWARVVAQLAGAEAATPAAGEWHAPTSEAVSARVLAWSREFQAPVWEGDAHALLKLRRFLAKRLEALDVDAQGGADPQGETVDRRVGDALPSAAEEAISPGFSPAMS